MSKHRYLGKFLAFKGMIFCSKFLNTILKTIASHSDAIPDFYANIDGEKVLILGGKTRVTGQWNIER